MSSLSNRLKIAERIKAMKMLKELVLGINSGRFEVTMCGEWKAGTDGHYRYVVDVIDTVKVENVEQLRSSK